jgi:alcohol dehydrogenase
MSSFHNPVAVRFGPGVFDEAAALLRGSCYLITSPGALARGLVDRFRAKARSIEGVYAAVSPNPTIRSIRDAAEQIGAIRSRTLVAIGGGSVLDAAKVIAAIQAGPGPSWLTGHLREGEQFPSNFRPPRLVLIPTTAGTGSELTMWATIWDDESRTKYSLSHETLYPARAFVDPKLTLSVPRMVTIATALDALSHAMEAVWNRRANPVSDGLAEQAISILPGALRAALENPAAVSVREALSRASVLAGLAFSNTRTALAHSISYPLTAHFGLPHGLACSITLPEILELNAANHASRITPIAHALGCASATDAADALARVYEDLRLAELIRPYITRSRVEALDACFVAPGRAENNLELVDNKGAKALLLSSLRRLGV